MPHGVHLAGFGRRLGAVPPGFQQPADAQVALGLALVARRVLAMPRSVALRDWAQSVPTVGSVCFKKTHNVVLIIYL